MKKELGRNMLTLSGLGKAGRAAAKKRKLPGASTQESTEIMARMGLSWPPGGGPDGDGAVDVKELEKQEPGGDWMTRLVSSDLFRALPPDNIQRLFAELETIDTEPGDIIVEQGTLNEFLYIVAEGQCVMTRLVPDGGPELMLGVLEEGDTFGEEALLCGARHNVSVKVLSGGFLMRLPRPSFEELVSGPAIRSVAHAEALQLVKQGAIWLDARMSRAPDAKTIAGSLCIPLNTLRFEATKLDRTKTYIVYAETLARRSSGAFLLARQGLEVYYLRERPAAERNDQIAATATAASPQPAAATQRVIGAAPSGGTEVADEVATLRAQLASMRGEMERATGERRQMAESARELRQRYDEALQAVKAERSRCDALEIKVALGEADVIRAADSDQAKSAKERQDIDNKLHEAVQQREKLAAHVDTLNQQLTSATKTLQQTQRERDVARNELGREREYFEAQLKESEQRVQNVANELRESRAAQQRAVSQFDGDRTRFEGKLKESTELLEQATESAHGLRQETQVTVRRLEQERARLESRLVETEGRLEDTLSTVQELQQERRATVSQLEQERARLESRLAEAEGRLEGSLSTLQEVQHERRSTVSQLEQERARLESRLAEAEGRAQENTRTLQELAQEHQQARAKTNELERERATLEGSLRAAEASLEELQQNVGKAASMRQVTERASEEVLQAQEARIEVESRRSQVVEREREALTAQLLQAQAKIEQATQTTEASPNVQRYEVLEEALGALHEQIGELAALREQVLRRTDSTSVTPDPRARERRAQPHEALNENERSTDEDVDDERPKGKLIDFASAARVPR